MKAKEHTLSMIQWWKDAGISHADLAVRRSEGTMLWHHGVTLDRLPLPWARAENSNRGEVYIRPARKHPWPLVFLDDVAEDVADRIARKYGALVVKTSDAGGCHVWLSCTRSLDEKKRHLAQRWLAPRAGADTASTSGEHLGRLAGFRNWKRNGIWVNVIRAPKLHCRWEPRAGNSKRQDDSDARSYTDTSPSGMEWGWVCGMLEAGLPPRLTYFRLLDRARARRRRDAERYARRTVSKALAQTRAVGRLM